MQGVDELLSATYIIGRSIAAITFPGMYRIYDFHSTKAPKLKNQRQFSFFAPDSDDENEDEDEILESNYSHFFNVKVGEDVIYLEDPIEINDGGWTALHTCCMSFLCVPAGLQLIEEFVKRGGNLDATTIAGPGTFNSEWTALHMACAYGISPLVERLIKEGANVNTTNSFGYTPLLECCHRGFQNIVESLAGGGADLSYIPSDEDSNSSPFVSAPAQSALGESARCGFPRIIQALLDAGSSKDQGNSLGWTALHEACFYNRIEVVKILMLGGANASLRTNGGALPYHLAGLQIVRTMLQDMGGPEVVPEAGDVIDMVSILRELTICSNFDAAKTKSEKTNPNKITAPVGLDAFLTGSEQDSEPSSAVKREKQRSSNKKKIASPDQEVKDSFLHSGSILGDLPSLNKHKAENNGKISSNDITRALQFGDSKDGDSAPSSPSKSNTFMLDTRADGKDKSLSSPSKKKNSPGKKKKIDTLHPDFPPSYLCQLSQKPMSEPVQSVYGNIFDRPVILHWMSKQGHICPLTGAPLSETDLKPMDDLENEIREWILHKSQAQSPSSFVTKAGGPGGHESATVAADDLYDF
jgi:hypothetical protein